MEMQKGRKNSTSFPTSGRHQILDANLHVLNHLCIEFSSDIGEYVLPENLAKIFICRNTFLS